MQILQSIHLQSGGSPLPPQHPYSHSNQLPYETAKKDVGGYLCESNEIVVLSVAVGNKEAWEKFCTRGMKLLSLSTV